MCTYPLLRFYMRQSSMPLSELDFSGGVHLLKIGINTLETHCLSLLTTCCLIKRDVRHFWKGSGKLSNSTKERKFQIKSTLCKLCSPSFLALIPFLLLLTTAIIILGDFCLAFKNEIYSLIHSVTFPEIYF